MRDGPDRLVLYWASHHLEYAIIVGKRFLTRLYNICPVLLRLYVPTLLFLTILEFVSLKTGVPFAKFTRDMAAVANVHPLTGMVSALGVLCWCATVAICFFGCALLKSSPAMQFQRAFLGIFGALTLLLCFDDLFMFHEWIFPYYFQLTENRTTFFYVVILMVSFWLFRKVIAETDSPLLWLAILLFAFSLLIDHTSLVPESLEHLVEDGPKFLGIISWTVYFWRTSAQFVRAAHAAPIGQLVRE